MTGNVQSGNLRRKGTQDRAPDEHKVALSNHLISRNSKEAKPHARMWGGGYRHPRSLQVSVWIHDVTLEQIHSVIQINHVILWARSFVSQHNLWQPSWRQPATQRWGGTPTGTAMVGAQESRAGVSTLFCGGPENDCLRACGPLKQTEMRQTLTTL